jgi:hypothetical protein
MTDDLHTYIEPELEARITALVLGEVSEFDVEELERMIEQQPELQIFRRRMEAMHELLGETVKPEKDEAWQLSDDRRDQLRRTFARQAEPACKASRVVSRAQWRSVIGIAACVVVCLVIFSVMDPLESPKSDFFTPQIISYQAGAETDSESSLKEKRSGSNQQWWLDRDESMVVDHLESDLEVDSLALGTESHGEKKMEKARGRSILLKTDLPKEVIEGTPRPLASPRPMTRGVARKPSAPSSSMAKVIASNARSNTAIPVPEVAEIQDLSMDFGTGSAFGDGLSIEGIQGNRSGALAMAEGEGDPFGGGGNSHGGGKGYAESDALLGDIPVVGALFSKTADKEERLEKSGSAVVWSGSHREKRSSGLGGTRIIDRETSAPSSSMGSVSAANTTSKPSIPVPEMDVSAPSDDLGNVDSFSYDKRADSNGADGRRDSRHGLNGKKGLDSIAKLGEDKSYERERRGGKASRKKDNKLSKDFNSELGLAAKSKRTAKSTRASESGGVFLSGGGVVLDSPATQIPGRAFEDGLAGESDGKTLSLNSSDYDGDEYAKAKIRIDGRVVVSDGLEDLSSSLRSLDQLTVDSGLQNEIHRGEGRGNKRKVADKKSDYYSAGYDRTRSNLLAEGDLAWKMDVPSEKTASLGPEPVARPATAPAKPVSGRAENKRQIKKEIADKKRNRSNSPAKKQKAMKVELQNKSERVAGLRKKLMATAEKTGIIYMETESGDRTVGINSGLVEMAEKELYSAERDKEQLTFQINKLLALDEDELIAVAADLPDVGFKEYYNKHVEWERELKTLKAEGLGAKHPAVVARQKAFDESKKSLGKRAVRVRESLTQRLTAMDYRVKKMQEVVNAKKDEGTATARDLQDFNIVRKEYQKALEAKNNAEVAYDLEKVKSSISRERTAKPKVKQIPAPKRPQALPEETKTSAQPFSTFSLNVADVSFKLAKVALLEKGQWPDAAKVRTEEYINAFDYGDPSPRRGEAVACAIEQTPHPFLQQRNLLRIGMKTAALGRSTPLRLTVLLDNSGSMEREDREASVLAAMRVLASQLGPQDKITLVGFARQPRLLVDRLRGDKAGKLVDVVANTPSEGGTNIEEALRLARKLAKRQHTKGAQDRIVLITDGVANLGNTVPEQLSREIEIMRQEGIAFDACGVGAEGLNDDILEALTRKGDGRYYFLNRPEDADSGFAKQLAGALSPAAKNVKVQVVFNQKRVTKYRLLGFEKHRLKKEDFRNDKVDAAEMAAEEAGNAVYQIQVNPDGEGDLGEVFVRFLDANTGRMVERSWPLAYESQMKPFDRATPSMQLAATAAMLGEKLHGTDAGSVRFQEISNTLGKLRAHYAANERVQDLIRMCEKVK